MIFYRCKCGKTTSWSSMGVHACDACLYCKSDLAEGPEGHREPVLHDYVESHVEVDDGKHIVMICKYCGGRKRDIEAGKTFRGEQGAT